MASDLLLGFILGAVLVGFCLPVKGIVFTFLEQRRRIEELMEGQASSQPESTDPFPNRKESS